MLQESSRNTIRKDILHAVDSGNHTCMVVDDVGNSGNATLNMQVSGMRIKLLKNSFMSRALCMYVYTYRCPGVPF